MQTTLLQCVKQCVQAARGLIYMARDIHVQLWRYTRNNPNLQCDVRDNAPPTTVVLQAEDPPPQVRCDQFKAVNHTTRPQSCSALIKCGSVLTTAVDTPHSHMNSLCLHRQTDALSMMTCISASCKSRVNTS